MKYYNRILFLAAALVGLSSCAIDEVEEFKTEQPRDMAEYEYLNNYDVLKNYVDRTKSPDFKLGAGVTASEFSQKGQHYLMAVSNFDEVTPGNAMKHSSVVSNKGEMNFATVTSFVDAARSAGTTIYGHTLAWHSQQNHKFLNSLIAPTVIPGEPAVGGGEGAGTPGDGGYALKITNQSGNGADNWSGQVWYVLEKPLEQGVNYTMSMMVKGTEAYTIGSWLKRGADGDQIYSMPGNIKVTTEWSQVTLNFTPEFADIDRFIFNFGDYATDAAIFVDDISLVAEESETNLIKNGDFEAKNVEGWAYWTAGKNYAISEDGEGYVLITGPVGTPGYALNMTNTEKKDNNWQAQVWYELAEPLESGTSYTFKCMGKATDEYSSGIYYQSTAGESQEYGPALKFTTEWTELTLTFSPSGTQKDKFTFNFGDFEGTLTIDNVSLTPTDDDSVQLIPNGDFENKEKGNWKSYGNYESLSAEGEGYPDIKVEEPEPGYAMNLTNQSGNGADNWSAQVWYVLEKPLEQGTTYTLSMMIKGTESFTLGSWLKRGADGDQIYSMPGNFAVTTEWAPVSSTFTPEFGDIDRFLFNFGTYATGGVISIDNISLVSENDEDTNLIKNGDFEAQNVDGWAYWTPGQNYAISELGGGYVEAGAGGGTPDTIIEKTPEEKKVILMTALENWIMGIMDATDGYVNVWDAVNEPISGTDGDGDGYYDLWSAENGSEPENHFYWQDYLGDEDYVPTVIKLAHKYYKGDKDLKLFINDYNLESDWDDNKKLKSLIHWIEVWESHDIIKIDGIGSQMHVSYYEDPQKQASKEEHYVKMLELMAATGKLVKISELDMGYVDADGNKVPTVEMTEEQHKAMASYYKFIVSKYFEIIPAAQQYGITQWCTRDAAGELGTGWRGGEPVGLWDQNYNRKHTYAGFAEGLPGYVGSVPETDSETAPAE